ncbi:MAG: class I SAM-dependent methyltransferase [Candidatus Peribacteria bacterium]|nr:MAG: class I SAM-dependent methyltransferase [Candidatus Peribacteria bacterium]
MSEAEHFVPGYLHELIPTILNYIKSNVPKNSVIADLGCGTGYTSKQIITEVQPQKIYCVDVQEEMMDQAKLLLQGYNVIFKNMDILDFVPEEKLDIVLCSLVLHNLEVPKKELVLTKVRSYVQQGGIFIWTDFIKHLDEYQFLQEMNYRKDFALAA